MLWAAERAGRQLAAGSNLLGSLKFKKKPKIEQGPIEIVTSVRHKEPRLEVFLTLWNCLPVLVLFENNEITGPLI